MLVRGYGYVIVKVGPWEINIIIDRWRNRFFTLLILISSAVLLWSYYYIKEEENYGRFVRLVLIFVGRMVVLIFGGALVSALIGWDGLGVTSFLLVIYYKNRKRLGSGIITALRNRIGDCFFLGVLGLFMKERERYWFVVMILLISITKRAQVPFSSWLPSAIAAPTPVRALVHSSTLVTAGVYLLIRFNNFRYEWIIIIGRITIIIARGAACVEIDIKKIVALSTLSQLGVIIVSLSLIIKDICFFHLIVHAIFKALIFIRVGVAIHSLYGTQELRSFNNIRKRVILPISIIVVANIALIGFPFIAGFFRKDIIMERFYSSYNRFIIGVVFLVGVGLTAAYRIKIMRLLVLKNERTQPIRVRRGGIRWEVKRPLLLLGICSVRRGFVLRKKIGEAVCLRIVDKIIPIMIMIAGGLMGFLVIKRKRFRSIIILRSLFQKVSQVRREREIFGKGDKEFIEVGPIIEITIKEFFKRIHTTIAVRLMILILIW